MTDSGFDIITTEEETSIAILQKEGFTISGMVIRPPAYAVGGTVSDTALDHLLILMDECGYKLVNKPRS